MRATPAGEPDLLGKVLVAQQRTLLTARIVEVGSPPAAGRSRAHSANGRTAAPSSSLARPA